MYYAMVQVKSEQRQTVLWNRRKQLTLQHVG